MTLAEAIAACPEVRLLIGQASERQAEAQKLTAHMQQLIAENQKLADQKLDLQVKLEWLTRQMYGARSERRSHQSLAAADQLWLGEQMLPVSDSPPSKTTTVAEHSRKARKKPTHLYDGDSRLRFDENVPREIIRVEPPEIAGIDPERLTLLSERSTYQLAQQAPYKVLQFVYPTYKIKGTTKPVEAKAVACVFEKSCADVSLLAGMAVDKYLHHLPLNRQHQRMELAGVYVDRGSLTRWLQSTAELLEPIYYALSSSVLQSKVLSVDESPTPAGRKNGKMHQGYYWVFHGDQSEVYFQFSPSRAAQVLYDTLDSFEGVLLSDGYVGYEAFLKRKPGILNGQCWVHARRNFIDAEKNAPTAGSCKRIIALIAELYVIEAEAPLGSEKLRLLRNARSRPLVKKIFDFIDEQIGSMILMRSSPFTKALDYMAKRRAPLSLFLERPELPLDTNHVERAIRPAVVGRKNWMFHVTEEGARHGAIMYSILQSCKNADVNPLTYLIDILQRVSTHLACDVHQLLPRNWKTLFGVQPFGTRAI